MDPTSSVIAIVSAAWKAYEYLEGVRTGGKERQTLRTEVYSIYTLFLDLQKRLSEKPEEQAQAWEKPLQILREQRGVIEQLETELKEIIAALEKASHNKCSNIVASLRWPLDKSATKEIIERLDRQKNSVNLAFGQANYELSKANNVSISKLQKASSSQRTREIIAWLSPLEFYLTQEAIQKQACKGTGEWFLSGDEFRLWSSGQVPVLWCHGIPGAGKTLLASAAFSRLQDASNTGENDAVLIAYCAFDDSRTHLALDLLWSLIRQTVQLKGTLSDRLQKLYDENTSSRPSLEVEQVCDLLDQELASFKSTFLILDGLDEMPSHKERAELLKTLESMKHFPKLLATSRPLADIRSWFTEYGLEGRYSVNQKLPDKNPRTAYQSIVEIAAMPEDIEKYINLRIDNSERLCNNINDALAKQVDLRNEIRRKVKADAQKMFLLAKYHMDGLTEKTSPRDVLNALQNLPTGINETYDQAIDRIERRDSANIVKRFMAIIAFARTPLAMEPLGHAMAVSPGDADLDELKMANIKGLVSMCAGFVEIDAENNVRFTHETIPSYMRGSKRDPFVWAEKLLAVICLTYLRFNALGAGVYGSVHKKRAAIKARAQPYGFYPFFSYASLYWASHVQSCTDDPEVVTAADAFLISQPHVDNIVPIMTMGSGSRLDTGEGEDEVTGLHVTAYYNFASIASKLVIQGADINAQDCIGKTPLMYAASKGSSEVTEVLLRHGAVENIFCERGLTAFHLACYYGKANIVHQLLYSGQDVEVNLGSMDEFGFTGLMFAIDSEFETKQTIAKMLIQHPDSNLNVRSSLRGYNALHLAVHNRMYKVAQAILESSDVEVDCEDLDGRTPLTTATQMDDLSIAELLLDHGANVNFPNKGINDSPFFRAIANDSVSMVRWYIDREVNYRMVDYRGYSSLHVCAERNAVGVFELLMDIGEDLDINGVAKNGATPLHVAAYYNNDRIARLLLSFGARTGVLDNRGKTPMEIAIEQDGQKVLISLREFKSDATIESAETFRYEIDTATCRTRNDTFDNKIYHTKSLLAAVRFLDVDRVEELISTPDADLHGSINECDSMEQLTPICVALILEKLDIVRALLRAGANVNIPDRYGHSCLHIAARQAHKDIVIELIENGADVGSKDCAGRTPLDLAISKASDVAGNIGIVVTLIKNGATFTPTSERAVKCLEQAVIKGDIEAVKIFIEKGVSCHQKSLFSFQPIDFAEIYCHTEIARILGEKMKNDKSRRKRRGITLGTPFLGVESTGASETAASKTRVIELTEAVPVNGQSDIPIKKDEKRREKTLQACILAPSTMIKPEKEELMVENATVQPESSHAIDGKTDSNMLEGRDDPKLKLDTSTRNAMKPEHMIGLTKRELLMLSVIVVLIAVLVLLLFK